MDKTDFSLKYEQLNRSTALLAKHYGKSESTIRNYIVKFNLREKATKPTKSQLKDLYCVKRLSMEKIGEQFGISRATVSKLLKEYNLYYKVDLEEFTYYYCKKGLNLAQLGTKYKLTRASVKRIIDNNSLVSEKDTLLALYKSGDTIDSIAKKLGKDTDYISARFSHYSIYQEKRNLESASLEEFNALRETKTLQQLAEYYSVSTRTISTFIKNNNLTAKNTKKFDFSKEDIEELYIKQDLTFEEVSNKLGCSRRTVQLAAINFDIEKTYKSSSLERRTQEYLDSRNIEYERNTRNVISPYELDFYLFEYDIGIELNGIYWHSTKMHRDKYNLYNKYKMCKSKNIRLINIFEDEINEKFSIVTNRLDAILNIHKPKVYARNCTIKSISSREGIDFLNKYHIQGSGKNKIYLGAYFDDRLVSVMSFSSLNPAKGSKSENGVYELNRFVNPYSIPGIAGKLFKSFVRQVSPTKIISYSDLRWNTGEVYKKLGFNYIGTSKPNYWYAVRNTRKHRWSFTKSKLLSMIPDADPNLTEEQLAESIDLYRVYDCGNDKFEWIRK